MGASFTSSKICLILLFLLVLISNAVDLHGLFQNAFDGHEGRQGTVRVLLDITDVGTVVLPAFFIKRR